MPALRTPLLLKICAIATLLLASSGCAITLKSVTNRFDSPEASGGLGKGHVDPIAVAGAARVTVVPFDTVSNPDTTTQALDTDYVYRFAAGVGLTERLDIDAKIFFSSSDLLQLKYQLLGDTLPNAKQGNFSLAVSAAAGGGGESGTDSDSGFSSIAANYNLSYSAWDAALIAGYRPLDWMLVYGGPFHSQVSYSGTLTQSGGTQATYALSGRLEQTGGNLGIMGNFNHFALQLEWAFANCQNASGGAIDAQTVGVNGRFYW